MECKRILLPGNLAVCSGKMNMAGIFAFMIYVLRMAGFHSYVGFCGIASGYSMENKGKILLLQESDHVLRRIGTYSCKLSPKPILRNSGMQFLSEIQVVPASGGESRAYVNGTIAAFLEYGGHDDNPLLDLLRRPRTKRKS